MDARLLVYLLCRPWRPWNGNIIRLHEAKRRTDQPQSQPVQYCTGSRVPSSSGRNQESGNDITTGISNTEVQVHVTHITDS